MKKRNLGLLMMALISVAGLSACGKNAEEDTAKESETTVDSSVHEHSYTEKQDSEYHWEECSCGDVKNKETHTLEESDVINPTYTEAGSKHVHCDKCGYDAVVTIPKLEQETPEYTIPSDLTSTVGRKASELTLPEGFTLKEDKVFEAAGDNEITLIYKKPNDTENKYKSVEVKATVTVEKATPVITEEPTLTVYGGMKASEIVFDGGKTSVPGTFEAVNSNETVPTGEYELNYKFIPEDTENYNEVSLSKSLTTVEGVKISVRTIADSEGAFGKIYLDEACTKEFIGGYIEKGGNITLYCKPEDGSILQSYTKNAVITYTYTEASAMGVYKVELTNVSASLNFTAYFEVIRTVTISSLGNSEYTLSGSYVTQVENPVGTNKVANSSSVGLFLEIEKGSYIKKLTLNGEDVPATTDVITIYNKAITEDLNIVIDVEYIEYQVTLPELSGASITLSEDTFHYGDEVTLKFAVDEELCSRSVASNNWYIAIKMDSYTTSVYSNTASRSTKIDENNEYKFTITDDVEITLPSGPYANTDYIQLHADTAFDTEFIDCNVVSGSGKEQDWSVGNTTQIIYYGNSYTMKLKLKDDYSFMTLNGIYLDSAKTTKADYKVENGYLVISGDNKTDGVIPSSQVTTNFYLDITVPDSTLKVKVIAGGSADSIVLRLGDGFDDKNEHTFSADSETSLTVSSGNTYKFEYEYGTYYIYSISLNGEDLSSSLVTRYVTLQSTTPVMPNEENELIITLSEVECYNISVTTASSLPAEVTLNQTYLRVKEGETVTVSANTEEGYQLVFGSYQYHYQEGSSYTFTADSDVDFSVSVKKTEEDAIHVSASDNLYNILNNNRYGYIILDEDITVTFSSYVTDFYGTIDGNNHTITITRNSTSANCQLLYNLTNAYIHDVSFVMNEKLGNVSYVSLFNTVTNSKLTNIEVSGTITATKAVSVSGFVNSVYGSEMDSISSSLNITSTVYDSYSVTIGGLAGFMQYSKLSNAVFNGSIDTALTPKMNYAGGLSARTYDSLVSNVYVAGSIKLASASSSNAYNYIGGMFGDIATSTVESVESANTLNIVLTNMREYIGGVAGQIRTDTVFRHVKCGTTINISGTCYCGNKPYVSGAAYSIQDATMEDCVIVPVINITPDKYISSATTIYMYLTGLCSTSGSSAFTDMIAGATFNVSNGTASGNTISMGSGLTMEYVANAGTSTFTKVYNGTSFNALNGATLSTPSNAYNITVSTVTACYGKKSFDSTYWTTSDGVPVVKGIVNLLSN